MSQTSDQLSKDQPLTNAAMDFQPCLVCSYDVVDEGYTLECGHIMHNECFDAFLQLEDLDCDYCASAQWYYSNGDHAYEDDYPEAEYIIQESGFSEAPSLFNLHDHKRRRRSNKQLLKAGNKY